MARHSDLRLVVIDTWARFSPITKGAAGNSYQEEYRQISSMKQLADAAKVSILLVHHLRKMEAEDIMDTFSGSLGLTGAADNLLVLATESVGHGPSFAALHVTGRDVEANSYKLTFDDKTLSWTLKDEAYDLKLSNQQRKIVEACKEATGPLTPTEIAKISGLELQYVKNTLPKLVEKGDLKKPDRGEYEFNGI